MHARTGIWAKNDMPFTDTLNGKKKQICWLCEEPTGRCKEDEILFRKKPICPECFDLLEKHNNLK